MTDSQTVTFTLNGKRLTVPKGTTVYTVAQELGIDIPIFCYHDRMPPFGACRVCLVEVEKSEKLQPSCTLEATEGMVVHTESHKAIKGREGILELLLINHPLDCPICDRGGECPLQDQTLKHGPGESRFYETKRHFSKPKPLGPVLMLDRERCIQCARCTRFGDLIAGDSALEFIDRGYRLEVGTPDGGPARSKFIGNTIQICPVGALTSDVYRFRARPWDNEPTESCCTLCPVGCSFILDERDGEIVRTRSSENKAINDIWLCDKGWFGYEFSSHPARLHTPLMRKNDHLEPVSWDEALNAIATKMIESKSGGRVAAFGGNPLTLEENYFFQKLMREGCLTNHLDHRIGQPLFSWKDEGLAAGMEISLQACSELDYAILLGVDLTEEFPLVWLRLRQALLKGAAVEFWGHYAPEIAHHLSQTRLHAPGEEEAILDQYLPSFKTWAEQGKKGALLIGSQYLHSPQRNSILKRLFDFQQECPELSLNLLEGSGNSRGARLAGMRPDLAPFEKPIEHPGLNARQVLEEAASKGWDLLYVAGANPALKFPSKLWSQARSHLKFLIVQDLFLTETAQAADIVLPTLSFVEKSGHFLTLQGAIQKLSPGKPVNENIYSDQEIFVRLAEKLHITLSLERDLFVSRKQREFFSSNFSAPKIEGDLKLTLAPSLFDQGVRMKHNTHLVQLAPYPYVRLHPHEAEKRELKHLSQIRLRVNGNEIGATLKWDPKVALGTVVLPIGFDALPVQELDLTFLNGLAVEVLW